MARRLPARTAVALRKTVAARVLAVSLSGQRASALIAGLSPGRAGDGAPGGEPRPSTGAAATTAAGLARFGPADPAGAGFGLTLSRVYRSYQHVSDTPDEARTV